MSMRFLHVLLAVVFLASFEHAQSQRQPPANLASTVEREISSVEKQVTDAAEAMPDEKFNFTPESLTIPALASVLRRHRSKFAP